MESENSRGWYAGRWCCSSSLTVSSQSECLKVIVFVFYSALLVVTVLLYVLSFTAVVLFFVFYTKPDGCSINKFFIGSNMLFSIIASVISVLPKVQVRFDYCQGLSFSEGSLCWTPVCVCLFVCLQESQPRSGLLQSSVITLYTMFLTWSAMTNEPGESVCCCWFEVTWTVKFWRAEPMQYRCNVIRDVQQHSSGDCSSQCEHEVCWWLKLIDFPTRCWEPFEQKSSFYVHMQTLALFFLSGGKEVASTCVSDR